MENENITHDMTKLYEIIEIGSDLRELDYNAIQNITGILVTELTTDANSFRFGTKDFYIEGRHSKQIISTVVVRDYTSSNINEQERSKERMEKSELAKQKKADKDK